MLHGEAVAYGLRAAVRIFVEVGVTPPERTDRISRLLDGLGLAAEPLSLARGDPGPPRERAGGRLRGVLPAADGIVVRDDIEPAVGERVASSLLAVGRSSVGL